MIQRRAATAGIKTKIDNHLPRYRITAYLKNKRTLEAAQHSANHQSPRTTNLYDRRSDEIPLDQVEKISINSSGSLCSMLICSSWRVVRHSM
jgi:hypothetical protein